MNGMFDGMFGKIAPGMCRLSVDGKIAIKTTGGYKTYDVLNKRLTNCDNFVFHVGEEFFFLIPVNRVKTGDIILAGGRPKCVIEADNDSIIAINYEDSTVETILPERHVFMGNTYFYGRIVSMFGNNLAKDGKGMGKILKYMMLSEMMKGTGGKGTDGMSGMLPLMLMGGGKDMFYDMFAFDFDEADAE
ncbi:MAG: hypothetical protein E7294_01680 [Lachnospiraceae bacterium]|nr:hypothetical protein [Lachnospiraceae bacterium]